MDRDETAALVLLESLLLLLIDKGLLTTDDIIHAIEDGIDALRGASDEAAAPVLRRIVRSVTAFHRGPS